MESVDGGGALDAGAGPITSSPIAGGGAVGLTPRERTVAELVADGHSNRDIAAQLHLSPRTVETHVSRILRKTGVRSRAGIARRLDGQR
ncbi:helix-turn-helix transcriptional regulator [Agromyces mediolanus]|uniref:helix-turn-helix domain-containing protein n=1 Tax=Agromyces mediolanus TaxID=41986 RepID=UPI002041C4A0|nr:helix-turn-helix transcriptional regulator [Agromyces mediolanus]MCM3658172.1 helix-turn-helix transcriptional regulator [Agromyces mediolanus]